ncbi:MAG: ABC transporter permease, partial [Pseudonocardiaceae bacterium]
LGIIIGVAAVILLVAIGNGVQNSVNERIEPLANLITVAKSTGNVPGVGEPRELLNGDVTALRKRDQAPDIAAVIPAASSDTVAETETAKSRTKVIGSTDRWFQAYNVDPQAGVFFDEAQGRSAARVIVLGVTIANNLFGNDPQAALGKTVRINHQNFKVIGVLEAIGEPTDSNSIMPLEAARRYVTGDGDELGQIIVQATQAATVPAAVDQVINILSDRHRINDSTKRDFEVQSFKGRLENFLQILQVLTLFTASVAAISLFVGGIGVLNIMLVSVTERTREIGIRKAIGATRAAILQQFLIESTVLASLGGLIGVIFGVGLSALGAAIAPAFGSTFETFAPAVSIPSILISFAISVVIGLVAGGYPANRAARLRPITALRYQ